MKKLFCFSILTLINMSLCIANGVFGIKSNEPLLKIACDTLFKQSTLLCLSSFSQSISGLSVTGTLTKSDPDYVVRIILKDSDGNEYLVLNQYEEINSDNFSTFTEYCEETSLLDNVFPDSLKIYIKNAEFHLDSLSFTHNMEMTRRNFLSLRKVIREQQVSDIVDKINDYNNSHNRFWLAGVTELSKQDYCIRKRVLGLKDEESSMGFEYYIGGIFEMGHTYVRSSQSISTAQCPDRFDWRNRHGINWMTPVRHQGWSNHCVAYAALGSVESLLNLYYNRKLDKDLSEQELASCAYSSPKGLTDCLDIDTIGHFIINHGVMDELTFPHSSSSYSVPCIEGEVTPQELVCAYDYEYRPFFFQEEIKADLFAYGPLYAAITGNLNHAMTLVGYYTIHSGDTISVLNPQLGTYHYWYVGEDDPRVGGTCWIMKNSYGQSIDYPTGYVDMFFPNNNQFYFNTLYSFFQPVTALGYTIDDIVIEDADGDGFFTWGMGGRPTTCPSWIYDNQDGDDSNDTIAYVNEYGKTLPFEHHSALIINHIDTISERTFASTDISIQSNNSLTIESSLCMLGKTKVYLEPYSILCVDGGVLSHSNTIMDTNSEIIVKNGGKLYMPKDEGFYIPLGASLLIQEGEICKPFIKKTIIDN